MVEDYEQLTNNELRERLGEHGLATSGNKSELVERLRQYELTGDVLTPTEQDDDHLDVKPLDDLSDADEPEPVVAEREEMILVKMTRANPTFNNSGYTFTQSNPFVLMPRKHADHFFINLEGFRQAFPHEAEQFYA